MFIDELRICDLPNHVHDPYHHVFDGHEYYQFYEGFEKHGLSIVEEHQKWMNSNHYDEGDESEYDDSDYDESEYDESDENTSDDSDNDIFI